MFATPVNPDPSPTKLDPVTTPATIFVSFNITPPAVVTPETVASLFTTNLPVVVADETITSVFATPVKRDPSPSKATAVTTPATPSTITVFLISNVASGDVLPIPTLSFALSTVKASDEAILARVTALVSGIL